MKLKVKPINLEVGRKPIIILNEKDVEEMGMHSLDRVLIKFKNKSLISIIDVTTRFAKPGEAVINDEITSFFDLKPGDIILVEPQPEPESVIYIKEKIAGSRLEPDKIMTIVRDIVDRKISDIELSAFVTALYTEGISIDEAENLSIAMVETGKILRFKSDIICDKHSIGGFPGDKTSLVLVPIIAASGLTIPKTSSRAVTSPAGTADRMEVLAPVDFTVSEIENIVKKVNACLVWGGGLDLAPADDDFIRVEYPLGIDPLLLPSIMSKKKAIGAHYVVIDIPTGKGTKIENEFEADSLADDFIELGKRLGIRIACGITFGSQPLGHCVGPALEAREALITLHDRKQRDIVEKATSLAGILLEMIGKGDKSTAMDILNSGKAEKKFREIIEAQGGNPKVKPSDIAIGKKSQTIKSDEDGNVLWIDNTDIAAIARKAGAPRDKGGGIELFAKMGDTVKKGDDIFKIYSNNTIRLNIAVKLAKL